MQMKSEALEISPVWTHWCADDRALRSARPQSRRVPGRGPTAPRVRVLPGNPSLPLRVLLAGLARKQNGGKDGTSLGIDLGARGHEVRKLFYAGGFTGVLNRENINPDEFLQEVYRGLLARNKGTCPWDYKKSSFGHYVHIVIRCVLSNYLRRERLRDSREGVTDDGELPVCVATPSGAGGVELRDLIEGVFGQGEERDRVYGFLSALYAGRSRKDALVTVGQSDDWGQRVLSEVKAALLDS